MHGSRIDTVELGARAFNNRFRGTDRHTGGQLVDQLLVPPRTFEHAYVPGSAAVFEVGAAALGNDTTRASDHLPVYAEFVFGADGTGRRRRRARCGSRRCCPSLRATTVGREVAPTNRRRRPGAGRQLATAGPGGNEFTLADRDGDPGFWVSRTLIR